MRPIQDLPNDIDGLVELIKKGYWFERLGDCTPIPDVIPFASISMIPSSYDSVAVWLPTSRSDDDPFGDGIRLEAELKAGSDAVRDAVRIVYKTTLSALREIDSFETLRHGHIHFIEAARGAASYASKNAIYCVILQRRTMWWRIFEIFLAGNWPYGVLPGGKMIVI